MTDEAARMPVPIFFKSFIMVSKEYGAGFSDHAIPSLKGHLEKK
jgi:hypothetical protein